MNSEGIWSDFKPDKEHNNYESQNSRNPNAKNYQNNINNLQGGGGGWGGREPYRRVNKTVNHAPPFEIVLPCISFFFL